MPCNKLIHEIQAEALQAYSGATPCPDDFDLYWDRALGELGSVSPDAELTEADFQVPNFVFYDLFFGSVRGGRIHCKLIKPAKLTKPAPALLIFHGYSGSSPDWLSLLSYASMGFVVCAMDARAQGGALSIVCAALVPEIKRAVSVFPYLCDFKKVWDIATGEGLYPDIKKYFREFDPTHEHEQEFFTKLGYIDIQNLAPRVKADVMLFTGLADRCCPPETQFAMYNKLKCRKSFVLYPEFGHEDLKGSSNKIIPFLLELFD